MTFMVSETKFYYHVKIKWTETYSLPTAVRTSTQLFIYADTIQQSGTSVEAFTVHHEIKSFSQFKNKKPKQLLIVLL